MPSSMKFMFIDFTMNFNSGVTAANRGKFLGMVEGGTTYNSLKTGIDHLKELRVLPMCNCCLSMTSVPAPM